MSEEATDLVYEICPECEEEITVNKGEPSKFNKAAFTEAISRFYGIPECGKPIGQAQNEEKPQQNNNTEAKKVEEEECQLKQFDFGVKYLPISIDTARSNFNINL